MKITCPKCHSTYKVDLPDSDEAGIEVQCGKCLFIFLVDTGIEEPGLADAHHGISTPDQPSDWTGEHILPPQKDEGQEVSAHTSQPSTPRKRDQSATDKDQEPPESSAQGPAEGEPEPIEIIVEDEIQDDSLEEDALDHIWDQAMQEGARTRDPSKIKTSAPPSEGAASESDDAPEGEQPAPPQAKKSKSLPTLEERQREIDQLIADHRAQQETPEEIAEAAKSQEEIDLEEQVTIEEGEDLPSWEEAFAHQAKVEDGWKKSLEQDRIQEEQQLADALGQKTPPEAPVSKAPSGPLDDKQSLVDQIFAEMKESSQSPPETAETPPAKTGTRQDQIDQIFAEAKAQQEKSQEDVDLEEQVVIDAEETMPSWEEAFAHQSQVEDEWKKAQEEDRIHEEQQLADALGEEYVPSEPPAEEAPVSATQENKQDLVDHLFAEAKAQQATDEQPADSTPEQASQQPDQAPELMEAHADQTAASGEIPPAEDLDDLDMKQLVTQAFKEESESQDKTEPANIGMDIQEEEEALPEPALTMETAEEISALEDEFPEETPEPEMEPMPELTLESETNDLEPAGTLDEEAASVLESDLALELEPEPMPELTLESATDDMEPSGTTEEEEIALTEPELTLESDPEPMPELTLESAEYDMEPADLQAELEGFQSEPEMEPMPELTLESATDDLEPSGTAEEEEIALTEPEAALEPEPALSLEEESELTMASEPEFTTESQEEPLTTAEHPADKQKSVAEEDIWADLFPDGQQEQTPEEETVQALAEEEESFEDNDFWDQVLEKDTPETEAAPQPVASAPVTDTAEGGPLTDEELWQQAFPGEDEFEPTAPQHADATQDMDEEDTRTPVAPLVIGAQIKTDEKPRDSLGYDKAVYEDFDDDEFEFQRRKRKLGPFTIPHGRRGDLVIGGAMVVFLLIAGGVYFTLQTFAPVELTDMQTAKTEVPEGLTPRKAPLEELAGELTSPKPEKTPEIDTPSGEKGEAILSDPSEILKESPEEKGILKDLAESQILKDTGKSQTAKIDQSALEALSGYSVTMSTIMPVAYNPTDIRVLSFSLEMQLSDAQSAKRVREALPVYEEIINQTVEDFLSRKFYNDILYVKEKLQKRLQTAMNKSIKNGRVRKTKFVDFAIQ